MQPKRVAEPDEESDLASRPGFLLRRAHQVAVAIFADEVGDLALTPPQHNVLSVISANPRCSQSALARSVGYDRATVGAVLAGLEARDLVKRLNSPTDGRIKRLTMTRAGMRLLQGAAPAMERINERILAMLSPNEKAVFTRLLARIALSDALPDASAE